MNKKLLAVAVAGIVAAPSVYADITAYGRIHNVITSSEVTDEDKMKTESDGMTNGSRFGFKGAADLGNGMSAFAQYEFGATTDNASDGPYNTRVGRVGVSGPFGSVALGQQWSAYYNHVGSYAAQNLWSGPGGRLGPADRTGNTIQYANSMGPVSMTVDARLDDAVDGQGNGFGIGLSLNAMDNLTLSGAFDSNDTGGNDRTKMKADGMDAIGVAASMGFGPLTLTVAHENQDVEVKNGKDREHNNTVLGLGFSVTDNLSFLVAGGKMELQSPYDGSKHEFDSFNASAVYSFGGGLATWIEFSNTEDVNDEGLIEETDLVAIGLRLDF